MKFSFKFLTIYFITNICNQNQCLVWFDVLIAVKETLFYFLFYIFSDDWPLERIKDKVYQTAYFWICVLDVIDRDTSLTYKYNIQNCIANTHLHCANVSAFVRKIRNVKERSLKRKNTDALSINVIECRKMQNIGNECKKTRNNRGLVTKPYRNKCRFCQSRIGTRAEILQKQKSNT